MNYVVTEKETGNKEERIQKANGNKMKIPGKHMDLITIRNQEGNGNNFEKYLEVKGELKKKLKRN